MVFAFGRICSYTLVVAEAPKVEKFRAIQDYKGEIEFPKGATLFVLGEADDKGNVTVRTT